MSKQRSTARLHHVEDGDPTAPVLVLGASIGSTVTMWQPQVSSLAGSYCVVRFDTRGHGRSALLPGPASVEELASDVVALLDSLGIEEFAYAGVSLGGAIGQVLGADYSDRVWSLVLCCTAAKFGEPADWLERAARVRAEGMAWLKAPTRERWFTDEFVKSHGQTCEDLLQTLTRTPDEGYASCCEALARFDQRDRLGQISVPTLVIAGARDPATPVTSARELSDGIANARLEVVNQASHLASVEQPEVVSRLMLNHLAASR